MRRRAALSVLVGALGGLAGCQTGPPAASSTTTRTSVPTAAEDAAARTIVVDAKNGTADGDGTAEHPYRSLQRGITEAGPGDTVHANPGVYADSVPVKHGGEPGNPLTITGPPDAVLTNRDSRGQPLLIRASHVHLRGLTIDGLVDPDNPDDPQSYSESPLVDVSPWPESEDYLEDLVIAPHGVGNASAHLIVVQRARNVEIGPLRVVGLAGANYVLTDEPNRHIGEIVYLGTPPDSYTREAYPWDTLDQTRNVHVHHIDNSAAHPHSELVNTKLGTRTILVEYCTDAGGSQNTEANPAASVRFQGYDATLRWCDLRGGHGNGVTVIRAGEDWLENEFDGTVAEPFDPARLGRDHEIYGNHIAGFDEHAIRLRYVEPDQQVICGNDIDGTLMGPHGEAFDQAACPDGLPEGDGIGHRGGEGSA